MNIDYLIPDLRLVIGDTDSTAYRYIDDWLLRSLILAVKSLTRYIGNKYVIDSLGEITRNPTYPSFIYPEEDGVVEIQDEWVIIIKAAIIVLGGSLENSAWDMQSWRDAEISVSSQEVSRTRKGTLDALNEELSKLVSSHRQRLARTIKGSLPGFLGNLYERDTEF